MSFHSASANKLRIAVEYSTADIKQTISAYAKPPTAEGSDLNTHLGSSDSLTCRERESRERGMEEGQVCADYVDSDCTQPHRKAL